MSVVLPEVKVLKFLAFWILFKLYIDNNFNINLFTEYLLNISSVLSTVSGTGS